MGSGPYALSAEQGYALAWLHKNPCRKYGFTAPNGESMSEQIFKGLCDLQLAEEVSSYRFVLTEAGMALYWLLVMTPEQRRRNMETYHEKTHSFRAFDHSDEEYEKLPSTQGRKARETLQPLSSNPYTEDSWERDEWNGAWLDADRWHRRDGTRHYNLYEVN